MSEQTCRQHLNVVDASVVFADIDPRDAVEGFEAEVLTSYFCSTSPANLPTDSRLGFASFHTRDLWISLDQSRKNALYAPPLLDRDNPIGFSRAEHPVPLGVAGSSSSCPIA